MRGDVKRAGASARTSEHDRASSYHDYTALIFGALRLMLNIFKGSTLQSQ